MPSAPENEKSELRARLRHRRKHLTTAEAHEAGQGLQQNLGVLVTRLGALSVSCYLSTPTEPSTRPFIDWALASGIRILFPISRDDGLLDWAAGGQGGETTGLWGISEPDGERLGPLAVSEVDLIIVPASAVDAQGTRLGWGRGYFDKTLSSLEKRPPVYAVVFDNEVLPEVPKEAHDQPVNGVVTPCRILDFSCD
ncbi:5-formyltetrahydrofolate cyclo-ligase [Paramicrobacterium chengjingii]|uniref:5-formyltetrahydrofolate cyclo-ligase n=1 Tax=Paramicrobacterium chengjingii TaxID=2769067 RepID=A0ABX6YEX2_9MICO|nr:5-formyltetrahydrofolate cyclo-ligase [Microbacterium chengjingii]QPZ37346.1 5-formyltetrahydrofolate cyclo-ligase [Microbacterium chengjingii]